MKTKFFILALSIVCIFASSEVLALVQFNDGETYNVNYGINNDVWVDYSSAGVCTILNWLEGASTGGDYDLQIFEDGLINIKGGTINDYFRAYNRSNVNMSGGRVYDAFCAYDNSNVVLSGGNLVWGLHAEDNATIYISGGSSLRWDFVGDSKGYISGGSVGFDLVAYYSSDITLSGGTIGRELLVDQESVVTILGSNFAIDGIPVSYGEITSFLGGGVGGEPARVLTGILANGDILNNGFKVGEDAKIILAPAPEPATVLFLGLGGVSLLRKRRK